jgi:transposase
MIAHADNTGPHVVKCVTEYMDHNSLKRAPHAPYSPDLAPSGFIDLDMSGIN